MPEQRAYVPGVPSYYMPSANSGTSSGSQTSGGQTSSRTSGGKTTTQQEYVIDWKTGTGEGTTIIKAGSLEEAQKIAQQRFGSQSAYVIVGGNNNQGYVSYGGSGTTISNIPQNITGIGMEYLKQASTIVSPPPRNIQAPEGNQNIRETHQFQTPYGPITSKEMELLQNMSPYLNQYMPRGMMTTGITAFEQQTGITIPGKTAKEKGEYVGLLMQKYDYIARNPNQPFVYYDKEGVRYEGLAQLEARKDERGNTFLVYSTIPLSPQQTSNQTLNNTTNNKKPTRALVYSPFSSEPQGYTLIPGKEAEFYITETARGNKVLLSDEQGNFVDISTIPRPEEPTQYLFNPITRTKTFIGGPTITNVGITNNTQQNNNIPLSENVRIYTREGTIAQRGEFERTREEEPRITYGKFNIATLPGPSQEEINQNIPRNIQITENTIYYTVGNTTYEKPYGSQKELNQILYSLASQQLEGIKKTYGKYGYVVEGNVAVDEKGYYVAKYKVNLSESQQEYLKKQREKFYNVMAQNIGEDILKTGLMHPNAGKYGYAETIVPYTITFGDTQETYQTPIPTDYTKEILINKYGARAFLSQETYELFKPIFTTPIIGTFTTEGLEAIYRTGQTISTIAESQQYPDTPKAYEITYGYNKERNIAFERTVGAVVSTGFFTLDLAILTSTVPAVAKASHEAGKAAFGYATKTFAKEGLTKGTITITTQAGKLAAQTTYEVGTFPIFTRATEYAVRAGVGATELVGFNVAKAIPQSVVRMGGGALKVMGTLERTAYIGVPAYDLIRGELSDFTKGRLAGITQTGEFLMGQGTYAEQKSAMHSFTIMNVPYYAIRVMSGPSKSPLMSKIGDIAYMTLNVGATAYLGFKNAIEINQETGKPYGIAYSMGKTSAELQLYDIFLESHTVDKAFESSRIAKKSVIGEQKLPLADVKNKLALTSERTDFSIITRKRVYEGVVLGGEGAPNVVKVKETSATTTKEFQFMVKEKTPIEEVVAKTVSPNKRYALDIQQIKFDIKKKEPPKLPAEIPVKMDVHYEMTTKSEQKQTKIEPKKTDVIVRYDMVMKLEPIKTDIKADTKQDIKTDISKTDISKTDISKTDMSKIDPSKIDITRIDFGKVEPSKIDVAKSEPSKIDITKIDFKRPADMKLDFPITNLTPPLFPPLRGGASEGEGFGLGVKHANVGHMSSIFEAMKYAERTTRFK